MHDDEVGTTALPAAPDDVRVLHSDPHDFAGLYIRHRASFTLHARHYLRDERDADEVVQEAFLRLFLALPELETELQALAYCRRTITNLCIDRYRAQARRPHLVDIASVPLDELADEEPLDPVVRAEDAALVRSALSMLSPLHRAALVKREIEEKSLPVIAEELEVPEESVKHLLFRARRALRRLLAGTSLAPGGDGQGLAGTLRAGSGGLAALLVLLVLGLGSGPDLKAIPVVGVDLPDILGTGRVADAVGDAVSGFVSVVAPRPAPAVRGGTAPSRRARPGDDLGRGLPEPRRSAGPSVLPVPAPAPVPAGSTPVQPALPAQPAAPAAPAPATRPVPLPVVAPAPDTPAAQAPSPDVLPPVTPDPATPPTADPVPTPDGAQEPTSTPTAPEPDPTAAPPATSEAEPLPSSASDGGVELPPPPALVTDVMPAPEETAAPLP